MATGSDQVGGVFVDVDGSLDAVEQGQTSAQSQQLVRSRTLHRFIDLFSAAGLRTLDQQVGLGVLGPLVEILLGVVYLGVAPEAVELLRAQLSEVLLDGRIGEADHHVFFVAPSEAEAGDHQERIDDAVEDRHVDRDRIAVDRRYVHRRPGEVIGASLSGIVCELDGLYVARERPHRLIAEELAPVAWMYQLLLQASSRAVRDLAEADAVGRNVGQEAGTEEDDRNDQQRKPQQAAAELRAAEAKRWQPKPGAELRRRRCSRFKHDSPRTAGGEW